MVFPQHNSLKMHSDFCEKSQQAKHTVLPDGQPPTVSFNVLPLLCGPQASEAEMGATSFTKVATEGTFTFT